MKKYLLLILFFVSQVFADVQLNGSALNLSPLALPSCTVNGQLRVDASFNLWICDSGTWTTIGGASAWGGITGTLSDQTDLQNALDLRVPYAGATGAVDLGAQNLTTTGTVTHNKSALVTTPAISALLANTTAAVTGSRVQVSPSLNLRGNGWRSGTSVSQSVDFRQYVLPVTGTSAAFGDWKLQSSIAGGAYEDGLTYSSRQSDGLTFGRLQVSGAIKGTMSNSSTIDTLQNLDLSSTGTRVNTTHSFGSTIRGGMQTTDQGSVSFYAAGTQPTYYFNTGSTIGAQNYILQIYGGGLYNAGASFNQSYLTAGLADTTPPATFTVNGSVGLKGIKAIESTPAGNASYIYCDTTNSNFCSGTPATACTSTSYGAACTARAAVGCSNNTTGNCGTNSNTDSGTCTGANAVCSWETSACSAYTNDMSGCNAAGFPSGSQCTFTPPSCSDFNTIATCDAEAGNGCSTNSSDCSTFDNTDTATCEANIGCSYAGDPVCSGTYLTSCSGTYTGTLGTCSGTFDTGQCLGGDYGTCGGTALCANLTGSGSGVCGAESGCTWTNGLTITLPAISTVEEGGIARVINIKKINSGAGTVTLASTGSDGFESGFDTTITDQNEYRELHAFRDTADCSAFNNNESTCNSNTGCSFALASCGSFVTEGACGGASGCTWNAELTTCEGTYSGTNGSCSGTYTVSRKWYEWGSN